MKMLFTPVINVKIQVYRHTMLSQPVKIKTKENFKIHMNIQHELE